MKKYTPKLITLVILLSGLAACSSQPVENPNSGSENQSEDLNLGIPDQDGEVDTEEIVAEINITGITWQWIRFEDAVEENTIIVPDPSQYSLLFNDDGSYKAKVDCNQANGYYLRDGSLITIGEGAMTRAMCPPESLDSTFLAYLFTTVDFVIEGENLVLNLGDEGSKLIFAPAPADDSPEIYEINWQWIRFEDTAGINNIVVEDPGMYSLMLSPDGTYSAKVDCNQTMGSYTREGSSIKFEPGISTLAECGPDSLYYTFLEQLGHVAAFVMDGENLVLNLWADGGNMVFTPAE
jgi:para-nitrobenzyl esterase